MGTDARDRFKNDAPFGMESRVHIMARYPVGREPVALREGRMVVLEGWSCWKEMRRVRRSGSLNTCRDDWEEVELSRNQTLLLACRLW